MKYGNVEFPEGIGFKCVHCGSCCKANSSDVNTDEQRMIEAKGFTDFLEGKVGDITRRIRKKDDGSCLFLTKDNTCAIYDIRPAACRLEPLIISDYDYENNTIELDINPAALVDSQFFCKGISVQEKVPVEEIAKAAQTSVQEALEYFLRLKGLSITNKEVASLTRQHFIQDYMITSRLAEAVSKLS
jgi:Fe-S-cluster containining protein